MPNLSLSIALLAYNEERSLAGVIEETLAFCRERLEDYEIIVVDDGSTDGTASVARSYAEQYPQVRLVQHERNYGMGRGIRTGIQRATKDFFLFNAADGQIPATEIGKLLPLLDRADIALSVYENRRETLARQVTSRAFRLYLRIVADVRFELEGLYIFPSKPAKAIEPLILANSFFFSFELVQRGLERGLTVAGTQLRCQPREQGKSKVFIPRRILEVGREAAAYGMRRWFYLGTDPHGGRKGPPYGAA
ncbi:MAG: glycosyltransferase family 2 protein [Myxococcota bacterium]|jgi:glycosyltransferase involved in cell wall biosynthesis|nr:glycosyltransferase family 2 protein [Myxococcota bacterium]